MAKDKGLSLQDQIDEQMEDLYTRALNGDMRAKSEWFDQIGKVQTEPMFNIQVNIVPYRIADPSLFAILQNADAQVVADALKGLTLRMKTDGFTASSIAQWESLLAEIFVWLEEMERPSDETY